MKITRFLTEQRIDLELDELFLDAPPEAEPAALRDILLEHMLDLLEQSSAIVNATKMRQEFLNSQRATPTLLGDGLFLPHVRTLQARRLALAVGVSRNGLELDAPDEEPVRLVIALVGPTYDEKPYLQIYRRLSESLRQTGAIERVVAAVRPGEVLRELSS